MAELSLTLLGTGSSGGVPRIGNDWGACDPGEAKNRRRRCSALIARRETPGGPPTRILIDTAPDLREQLLDARIDHLDAVVFSHDHADQTHGLDDLRVLAIRHRARVPVYMDASTASTLVPKFGYCFEGANGYPSILDKQPLIEAYKPFSIDGKGGSIELLPLDQDHGAIRSLGFRCGPLAYCNDLRAMPERSIEALEGLDILVIDALRYTSHPTHLTLEDALSLAQRIGARRTVLTNMHIDLDYETVRRETPENVEPGYDGMVLTAEA